MGRGGTVDPWEIVRAATRIALFGWREFGASRAGIQGKERGSGKVGASISRRH